MGGYGCCFLAGSVLSNPPNGVISVISYLLTYAAVQPDVSRKSCAVKFQKVKLSRLLPIFSNWYIITIFHGVFMVFPWCFPRFLGWCTGRNKPALVRLRPCWTASAVRKHRSFRSISAAMRSGGHQAAGGNVAGSFGMKTGEVNHNRTKYHGWLVSHVGIGQNFL